MKMIIMKKNIIKGLLNNINEEEKNMDVENDDDNEEEKEKDEEEKIENEEKMNNNEKNEGDDEKSKFKIYLINLLKNNNFMQQRAVKMTITNFLELLNLFNNNGIHFN